MPAAASRKLLYVPEEVGAWVLPQAEAGLDVLAGAPLAHQRRSREQRRVTALLHRDEELGGIILAVDGVAPDVGHEVL